MLEEMTVDDLFAEIARRVPDGAAVLLVAPRLAADDEKMRPWTHGSILACGGMCHWFLADLNQDTTELDDPDDWQK